MYSFDNQLPKTTTYWKDGDVFYIKHTSFLITKDEAYGIAELLKAAHRDSSTKAIIIDNREAKGAWTQDINNIWMEVSEEIRDEKPKKYATLTDNVIAAMQINRLSKTNGTESMSKAFYSDFNDEVRAFINA